MGGRLGGQFPASDQPSVLLLRVFFFEHDPASTFFSKYPTLLSTLQESGTCPRRHPSASSQCFFPLRWQRPCVNFQPNSEKRRAREPSGVCDPWPKDHAQRCPSSAGTPEPEA